MEFKLTAQKRVKKEKLDLEALAAIVYGKNIESQPLKLNRAEFNKVFNTAGESNLIDLELDGVKTKVLVKEIQKDPVKDWLRHVDLYQVNMKEKINTEIPLHFIGESKAVKELGGILIKEITEIKVECLPGDLVDHIDVDISVLKEMDDMIKISDLSVDKNMEILLDPNTTVAMVTEPKEEEEPVEEEPTVPAEGEEKTGEEAKEKEAGGEEGEKKEKQG